MGTADDNCAILDSIVTPGPDGKLGTADDVNIGLSNFTRTITITAIPGTTEVRQITVTINLQDKRVQSNLHPDHEHFGVLIENCEGDRE